MGRRKRSSVISPQQLANVVKAKGEGGPHSIPIGKTPTQKNQPAASIDPYAFESDSIDVGAAKESKDVGVAKVVTKCVR